jgi:tRNA-2-methylthio-N6-dimethylallyladenosine synthase
MLVGRRFSVHTFGCQMNVNDSEHMTGLLLAAGAEPAPRAEESDIFVVNTCAVRAKSVDKVYSLLGRIKKITRDRKVAIAVTGCVAQLYRREILIRYPFVDLVIGPDNYAELPRMLREHESQPRLATAWHTKWQEIPVGFRAKGVSGYITVMEGCNNFCSYCVVPYTRGREKFRPSSNVLREAEQLASQGYREIQLLGQNINVYRDPETGMDFPALLKLVSGVPGVGWIRFITSHPRDLNPDLVGAMRDIPQVCRQLHLPVQAGADAVLERMHRGYSRQEYLERIDLLRSCMPDIALSTDIIVGFPGETDQDFQETLNILEQVRFTNIFSFRYSPRPRTAAARNLSDTLPLQEKKQRLMRVQDLQKKIQLEKHRTLIGTTMTVLCTGVSKKNQGVYAGRNEANQVINFRSPRDPTGWFIQVEITESGPYSLKGKSVSSPSPFPPS